MVSLLTALMVSAFAGMGMGSSGIDALFFSRAGVAYLPIMYMALGIATLVTMLIISALLGRVDQRALYITTPLLMAIFLVGERAMLLLELTWLYPMMWLAKGVMTAFQNLSIWGLAGAICDTRQAKRLFPLFSAGTILGTAVGSLLTPLVVNILHSENLILVWAASLGVSYALGRTLIGGMPATARKSGQERQPGIIAEMRQGFEFVRKSRFLVLIAVSAFFFSIAWFSLEFSFNSAATAAYPDVDSLAGFLGIFTGVITAVALVISLFGANRLFARFGIMPMLFTFPLIYVIAFITLPFVSPFPLIAAFRFAQIGWGSGVAGTAWQAMFNVISAHRRDQARAFIGGVPEQVGVLAAGALLIIAQEFLQPQQVYWIGLGVTIPILFVLWRAIAAYRAALVDALRAGQPQVFYVEEEPFGGFARDAIALDALIEGISNPDPVIRHVSIEVLGNLRDPQSAKALLLALDDSDPTVRVAALKALARTGGTQELIRSIQCLSDQDADVRLAAATGLRQVASQSPQVQTALRPLLADPVPATRARAALALADLSDDARVIIKNMASDSDAEARTSAITALGEWGNQEGLPLVKQGLGDPNASVRRAAASALAQFDHSTITETLVGALGDPDRRVRQAVASALGALGEPSLKLTLAALADPQREAGALAALECLPIAQAGDSLRAYARERTTDALGYYRLWAVIAAQQSGDRSALLADSLIDQARHHAVHALRAIGLLSDRVGMALALENLRSANPEQRSNALETLEAMGTSIDIIRPLPQIFDPKTPEAADPTDTLLRVMQDRNGWLRACGTLMAAESDHWEIKSALEVLANSDEDSLAKETAAHSLKRVEHAGRAHTLSTMEQILFLRRVALFANVAPAELREMARITGQSAYKHGSLLGQQGELGDRAYVITFGEVRVVASKAGKGKVEVARCRVGDIIGEMSIISQEPRMASLIADGPVRALSIERDHFTNLLRERPQISLAVIKVLCARLRALA